MVLALAPIEKVLVLVLIALPNTKAKEANC